MLVLGEPGTGREAFARYIHALSPRASGPFVALVAGAVTESNAEDILLGVENASGTTAGVLEQAQGGMLFINGLEDLPPAAQRLLLAVIESGSFQRTRRPHCAAVRRAHRVVGAARLRDARAGSRSATTCCPTSTC